MVLIPSQMTGGEVAFQVGQFFEPLRMSRRNFPSARSPIPIAIPVETLAKGPPPGGATCTIHMHHLYAAIQF